MCYIRISEFSPGFYLADKELSNKKYALHIVNHIVIPQYRRSRKKGEIVMKITLLHLLVDGNPRVHSKDYRFF